MSLGYLPALAGLSCIFITIWFLTRCAAAFDAEHARAAGKAPGGPQGGAYESQGHHASPGAHRTA